MPCTRVLINSPLTRVLTDSYHAMPCQSVIKPIICGLHPMIILQQSSFVFKPKAFWMLHLHDHLYSKPCDFLWVAHFWGLIAGFPHLPTLSRAFTVGHICITKNTEAFTRGGIYPYLLLPDTFSFSCIQLCDFVRHCPNVPSPPSITKHNVDHNHELTPIQCDVPMHMQCNAPLHVISCHMYDECYMDNIIHTTYWVSCTITSPAYDFHTSFHSCQYIMHAYININIQHVILCSSNDTNTIKPCNGHLHIPIHHM